LIASLATRGAWKGKFVNFSSGAQHLPSTPSRAALSWSGGKDACLAWLRAQDMGLNVSTFVTMCGAAGGRSLSHSLPRSWLAHQVAACGVTWMAVDVPSGRPNAYASAFDHMLATLHSQGHTHMVFGDIDLAAHRDWIEPRCTAAGLIAVFPLWQEPRPLLAQEIIQRGIQARLVAVDLARLDASFCGARYDQSLLDSLPDHVCPCGEEGEFHTAVTWATGMRTTVPLCVTGVQTHAGTPPYAPAGLAHLQITDMPALP
jgi:diphthine-ammonia ligase